MVDAVTGTEVTASLGGIQTIGVVSNTFLELRFQRERAERAEARNADLERAASWTNDRVAEYERRIATLEANTRVGALETRQARRDKWWAILVCALIVAGILALAWATGRGL